MYQGYLTDIEGIKVGHMEDREALTGSTVIIMEDGMTAGVDVRGSGPGTRETDIFDTKKTVDKIHALVLTGGSAFGLDAAGGVMKYLEENDIGFDVGVAKVPIVPAAVIFDLGIGNPKVRPDFKMGYEAAKKAIKDQSAQGNVGAGMGASVGKLLGQEKAMKGGLGSATVSLGDIKVSALVVVNAVGDVFDLNGKQIAGIYDYDKGEMLNSYQAMKEGIESGLATNTTIGVVATNARLSKSQCNKLAEITHNAYARTINPVHTLLDGDTIFALASGELEVDLNLIGMMAVEAMSKAIINGVRSAESVGAIKAIRDI